MKPKKEDEKVKRKQASEAIKKADIESEMLSKRDDRPVAVARPVVPMVKPAVASNPAMDEMRNADLQRPMANKITLGMKKGGMVKSSSASSRADGCAQRGKTKGRVI